MDYFPLFLKLKQEKCLVIGAGEIAARKIELLARAGANITVIATEISTTVADLKNKHTLTIKNKAFVKSDVEGYRLVVSATNNSTTNLLVSNSATELNIPVNVVDNPALCSFIFPAIIDRSPVIAAVSSGGSSPVLARLLRAKIESIIPPAFGQLAQLAEKFRPQVKQQIKQPAQRRIFWENVLQGRIAELVFSGKKQLAEVQLLEMIEKTQLTDKLGEV